MRAGNWTVRFDIRANVYLGHLVAPLETSGGTRLHHTRRLRLPYKRTARRLGFANSGEANGRKTANIPLRGGRRWLLRRAGRCVRGHLGVGLLAKRPGIGYSI